MQEKCVLEDCCRGFWYAVDVSQIQSTDLASRFVQMNFDDETEAFLASCDKLHERMQLQLWHAICIPFLRLFLRQTCVNGLLNRGAMFLFSGAQLATLLQLTDSQAGQLAGSSGQAGRTVLDLGAGDGHVTLQFRRFYTNIIATEASSFMCQRLKEKDILVVGVDDWQLNGTRVDLISCLNLLDRHARPRTLLKQLHRKSSENGCPVLLSVVLPWDQYVEYSQNGTTMADETVSLAGQTFEQQTESLVRQLFTPARLAVQRFTRLPYLCEGNLHVRFFVLHCAVFLLKPV